MISIVIINLLKNDFENAPGSVEAGATTALASLVSHATGGHGQLYASKQNNENSPPTKPFKTLTLLSGLWMLCECLMGLMERLIVQTAIDKGWEKTLRLRILRYILYSSLMAPTEHAFGK